MATEWVMAIEAEAEIIPGPISLALEEEPDAEPEGAE